MTTPTPTRVPEVARKRPTKTRSKTLRVSSRPPLAVSSLRPTALDLSPGHEHLVCPDCGCWTPMTGIRSTPHLVPHHTEPAGTLGRPHRCIGSNRLLTLDIDADLWQRHFAQGGAETGARRTTKVQPSSPPPLPYGLAGLPRTAAEADPTAPKQSVPQATPKADASTRRRRSAEWARVASAVERVDDDRDQVPEGDAPTEHDVPIEPLGMAYKVLAHLGPDGEQLGDETLWQHHRRGGASMALAPGLRLVWHADLGIFAVAQAESRIETTITPATVGQVLAILAHNQA
ncbi:hypothetical protein [Streptomyces sp. SID3343]|uniref:hypothetical protein n=1 Tax=Streptomyces sp. SID3343 TaxID=2690260 RepID=UPI00136EC47D|nr:hypothetical protein [Streptomyces sp. SID3343]MYW00383.1 hypothetical protein [Streptomyces sp. SID3343]MYW04586.1 hypothetical protein [Streptomyces sp. SID3343]